jgi:hypothetical protein
MFLPFEGGSEQTQEGTARHLSTVPIMPLCFVVSQSSHSLLHGHALHIAYAVKNEKKLSAINTS